MALRAVSSLNGEEEEEEEEEEEAEEGFAGNSCGLFAVMDKLKNRNTWKHYD